MNSFKQNETGAITVFGLFLFAAIMLVGGLAIDMTYLVNARSQMQVTADLTAHAALYNRDIHHSADRLKAAEIAKAEALKVVEATMPKAKYGEVIKAADITFGTYDVEKELFTPSATSAKAVHVSSTRLAEKANPVSTFVLRVLGFGAYDVAVQSIFTTFRPTCFREGFVSDEPIDIQSNNAFTNGFCLHSNSHVSLNSNSTFETGTVVAMPDMNDLDMPTSGWISNDGLGVALRDGAYRLRIVNKLEKIKKGLEDRDPEFVPDYIDLTQPVEYVSPNSGKGITMADLTPGRIHVLGCHSNGVLKIDEAVAIREVVILTDCQVKFGQALHLEDVVLFTSNPIDKSITSASNLFVGKDDGCSEGGGTQLLTLGGMSFTASLSIYGSQLIARGDIEFSANANGIQGASIIAGGTISGTSNMDMGFCGTGMENNFEAEYFRLAY